MHLKIAGLVCAALLFAGPALAQAALQERCAKGQGDDTIAACSDIIGIGSGGAEIEWAYFDRARAYFAQKMWSSAIEDLTEALKRKPDDAEALENRGLAFVAFGDYSNAVHDFGRALDLKPGAPDLLRERCWSRAANGHDLDDALDDCNKALAQKTGDMATLDARCFVQFRSKAYAAAIADCSSALTSNPQLASSLYLRGLAKTKSGDAAGGENDIAAAMALDPSITDTFTGYGVGR